MVTDGDASGSAIRCLPRPRGAMSTRVIDYRREAAHEVVDQVVAVLGEDRLGVELDAAEVRPGDLVHVAGGLVALDA